MESASAKKVRVLIRLLFLWAALVIARLFELQIVQHQDYRQLAQAQQEKVIEIQAPRGAILDRTGLPLAMSVPSEAVCVNPLRVPDLSVAADILGKILGLEPGAVLVRMKVAAERRNGYLVIKKDISPQESERLRGLKLEWIEFRTGSRRVYPHDSMAAHVLGGVDSENKGNAGIEQTLNEDLQGHAGYLRVSTDVQQRRYGSQVDTESTPGRPIKLTIHAGLQYMAEVELAKAVRLHKCKSGSLVAMDPKTGEILALANYPSYNPNVTPQPGEDLSARSNLAIMAPFEPGSCFKVVTISAALETTRMRPETVVSCGNGSIRIGDRIVHDHNSYSSLPIEDVLARSSNIGAINIGLKVGKRAMYSYVRGFGFGRSTGLALPGESAGLVRSLKVWDDSSLGSVSMGHEISVTSVQLAQACSIIANGGFQVKPRLLMDAPRETPTRVLKPETAITMRRMMEGVVLKPYGTGHKYAQIPGYTSGGKTGTAQIYDYKAHVYTHLYNASFMGFAPVTDPAIVVVVTVNGASGTAGYGGPASAPVFREVAAAALRLLDVPKDLPDSLPDLGDSQADDNDLAIAGLGSSVPPPLVQPDGGVAAKIAPDQRFFLTPAPAEQASNDITAPKTPNFLGLTLRDVVEQSSALGIPVEFTGGGIARAQSPAPGAPLPLGEKVRVQFGR
jgi:cell division protein FtsI (penicillin-binding protein 3)